MARVSGSASAADVLSNLKFMRVDEITEPIVTEKGSAIELGYTYAFGNTVAVRLKGLNDPEMVSFLRTQEQINTNKYPHFVFMWAMDDSKTQVMTFGPYFCAIYARTLSTGIINFVNGNGGVAGQDALYASILPEDEVEMRATFTSIPGPNFRCVAELEHIRTSTVVPLMTMEGSLLVFPGWGSATFYAGYPPTPKVSSYDDLALQPLAVFTHAGSAGHDRGLIYTSSTMTTP